MKQVKEQSMLWLRQPTWVVGAFAGVAALLAALAVFLGGLAFFRRLSPHFEDFV